MSRKQVKETTSAAKYLRLKQQLPAWLTDRLDEKTKAACEGKVRYGHQDSADRAVNAMFKKHGGNRMESYHCETCGAWHIGHSNAISILITRD